MELTRAKMFVDGFKAAGLNAHEAEVFYPRKRAFQESDVRFANELRHFRNGSSITEKALTQNMQRKSWNFWIEYTPFSKNLSESISRAAYSRFA